MVAGWRGYSCQVPEIAFPLIDAMVLAAGIKEKDVRIAINQPATIKAFHSLYTHGLEGTRDVRVGGFLCFHFHGGRFVREWTDEGIPVAKLGDGDGNL